MIPGMSAADATRERTCPLGVVIQFVCPIARKKNGRKWEQHRSFVCCIVSPTMDLPALRQLKNSVIGNTWKKVQLAADTPTLTALILLLHPANSPDTVHEAAVILASIATVGNLTLRPIITNNAPARLLHLIHPLVHTQQHPSAHRQLTALLRALRNVLVATADMVWGHVWGVGAEKKVVGTGLVGGNVLRETPADRSRDKYWRNDAMTALTIVFEVSSSMFFSSPSPLLMSYHVAGQSIYPSFTSQLLKPSNSPPIVPTLFTSCRAPIKPPSSCLVDKSRATNCTTITKL